MIMRSEQMREIKRNRERKGKGTIEEGRRYRVRGRERGKGGQGERGVKRKGARGGVS